MVNFLIFYALIAINISNGFRLSGDMHKRLFSRGMHKMLYFPQKLNADAGFSMMNTNSTTDDIQTWLNNYKLIGVGSAATGKNVAMALFVSILQKRLGFCDGGIGEIGVYHGRFIAGLILTDDKNGTVGRNTWVCDIFEHQEKNPSFSGQGDLDILQQNLARFGIRNDNMQILSKASYELNYPADMAALFPARIG